MSPPLLAALAAVLGADVSPVHVSPVHVSPVEERSCPSPTEIAQQVTALLGDRAGRLGLLRTYTSATELEIEARLTDDPVAYRRVLALPATCRDRIEAAAVVIVAWLSAIEGPTPAGGALPAPPTPATAGVAAAPPPMPPPAARDAGRLSLGALAVAGVDSTGGWGGARIDVGWTRRRLGVRFGLLGAPGRDVDLGSGGARWWQVATSLGFAFRLPAWSGAALWAEAGPTAAFLVAEGRGLAINSSDAAVAWGGRAALRLELAFGRWAALAEVGGSAWVAAPENLRHRQQRGAAADAPPVPVDRDAGAGRRLDLVMIV